MRHSGDLPRPMNLGALLALYWGEPCWRCSLGQGCTSSTWSTSSWESWACSPSSWPYDFPSDARAYRAALPLARRRSRPVAGGSFSRGWRKQSAIGPLGGGARCLWLHLGYRRSLSHPGRSPHLRRWKSGERYRLPGSVQYRGGCHGRSGLDLRAHPSTTPKSLHKRPGELPLTVR